jgi:hypothetical protein
MAPSFPTLKLRGKEHSNCTPWAQRSVDPKLGPPAIQLLDFLYGEWGVMTIQIRDWIYEFVVSGIKEARACVFGV